jgi:leucyl aminopeptidase
MTRKSAIMKISFAKPAAAKTGALVLFATKGPSLTPAAQAVDKATKGALGRALKAGRYAGETADILEILAPAGLDVNRILLVGLGDGAKANVGEFERAGGAIAARLQSSGETQVSIMLDDCGPIAISAGEAAARLAGGLRMRSYRFDKYRTREAAAKKPSLTRAIIMTSAAKAAEAAFAYNDATIDGLLFARDLVSEPANVLYPKSYAERIKSLGQFGVDVEILGEREMKRLGMGSLLGVSQGSAQEPQLVIMQWNGLGKKAAKTPPVALIGKGVTFDTGGISIKPAAGMEDMKWDMGGSAAVVGAMMALAKRKAKAHVVGVVALVENMPGGKAQRPGDVVKSMSGQTIEVINTDAEGRLILCDAMTYTQQRFKPKVMVDLATLTGAIIISLGHEFAGMFTNDDVLAKQLAGVGFTSGDKLWRLPIGDAYDKMINSPIADMKNVGPREAGSITAAQFLKRFVDEGVSWAHLDIAGMAWSAKDTNMWEKGATGFGVRLLDRFIAAHHEET